MDINSTKAYVNRLVEIFQEFADKHNLKFEYLIYEKIGCVKFRFTDLYTHAYHERMYTYESILDSRGLVEFIKEETLKALKSY